MMRPSIWFITLVMGILFVVGAAYSAWQGDEDRIADGAKVTISFTIMVPEVPLIIPDNVSEYVAGQHQLVPELEKALKGLKRGDQKRIDLEGEEAFGPYDERKKTTISRDQLPHDAKLGAVYETLDSVPFTVLAFSDHTAVIDFNHPLAGKHLVFDVQVLNVEHGTLTPTLDWI
jgi:FKBP-type peptidyl-prolyl cis-trans isomerase 2